MLVVERKKEKKVSTPNPLVKPLLKKFGDVFPNDISSGLPPICGTEHDIDLIPKVLLPNRVAYRCNPIETKEFQRQVDELIIIGFVKESI